MAETKETKEHKHRWMGYRGGMVHYQMCMVCGKTKDEKITGTIAPAPEPVEVEVPKEEKK